MKPKAVARYVIDFNGLHENKSAFKLTGFFLLDNLSSDAGHRNPSDIVF